MRQEGVVLEVDLSGSRANELPRGKVAWRDCGVREHSEYVQCHITIYVVKGLLIYQFQKCLHTGLLLAGHC